MTGKFQWRKLSECNLMDEFFNSLRTDYPQFNSWFETKSKEGKEAFIFTDDIGIGAFICLKPDDNEPIELVDKTLPAKRRFKISTLKISDRYAGMRLGEGAIGIALWHWQENKIEEIYVTVFEKHKDLIGLIEKFGFINTGIKKDTGEIVFLKSRLSLDYSDPYKAFPFINPEFNVAGLIPISQDWHDTLFPYSELMRTKQEAEEIAAANGITKVYIGTPSSQLHHKPGEPVIIYRISDEFPKTYHSAATSYCVITKMQYIRSNWNYKVSQEEFIQLVGNKSVFSEKKLLEIYNSKRSNIVVFELLYNGVFGKGHNISHNELQSSGLWFEKYPYEFQYSKEQFLGILKMGDKDVKNIIIN